MSLVIQQILAKHLCQGVEVGRKARLLASRSLQYSRKAGIVSVGDLQRIQQEQVVILMVRKA